MTRQPVAPPSAGGSYVVDTKSGKRTRVEFTANPGDPEYLPQGQKAPAPPAEKAKD